MVNRLEKLIEYTEAEKQQLLNDLYYVYQNTENEAAFEIIGRAIQFVKTN